MRTIWAAIYSSAAFFACGGGPGNNTESTVAGVIAHTPVQMASLGSGRFAASVFGRERLELVSLDGDRTLVPPPLPECKNILEILAFDVDGNGIDDVYVGSPVEGKCRPWVALDGGFGEVRWFDELASVQGEPTYPTPTMLFLQEREMQYVASYAALGATWGVAQILIRSTGPTLRGNPWISRNITFSGSAPQVEVSRVLLNSFSVPGYENHAFVRLESKWVISNLEADDGEGDRFEEFAEDPVHLIPYEGLDHMASFRSGFDCGIFATGIGVFVPSSGVHTRESVVLRMDIGARTISPELLPFTSDRVLTQVSFEVQGRSYIAAVAMSGGQRIVEVIRGGCEGFELVSSQEVTFPAKQFRLKHQNNAFVGPGIEGTEMLVMPKRHNEGEVYLLVYDGVRLIQYRFSALDNTVSEMVLDLGYVTGEVTEPILEEID